MNKTKINIILSIIVIIAILWIGFTFMPQTQPIFVYTLGH